MSWGGNEDVDDIDDIVGIGGTLTDEQIAEGVLRTAAIEDSSDDEDPEAYGRLNVWRTREYLCRIENEWGNEEDDEYESDAEASEYWGNIPFQRDAEAREYWGNIPFHSDVENVEFPVTNVESPLPQDGGSEDIEDIVGIGGTLTDEQIAEGVLRTAAIEDSSDDEDPEAYGGLSVWETREYLWQIENEWGDEEDDEWESDAEAGEYWGNFPFPGDVENVEFPVSNVESSVSCGDGSSEVPKSKKDTEFDRYLMLYLVGEELRDDGSSSATGTSAGVQSMISQTSPEGDMVCKTLPEEVVEAVLLRLPVAAQARCRAVCKAWLGMLTCSQFRRRSFLHSLSGVTPPLCAFRFCPEDSYEPPAEDLRRISRFKSLRVDLSFLPEVFRSYDSELHNCPPSGLMCVSRRVVGGMLVCVLNPVNQSFKVLPLLQKRWGYYVVLLMGPVTSATESMPSFKVYVSHVGPAGNSDFLLFKDVAIYSSISGEWKGFLGRPELETSDPPVVVCNGDVYTTVDSSPPLLVRLSTEKGPGYLWHMLLPGFRTRRGQHWETEFSLVGYRGKLLCCCGGIWMLDNANQMWVKIAERCPPDILQPFLPPNPEMQPLMMQNVHVAGDLVVFFYKLPFDVDRPVAYDMVGRFWRKVPQICAQAGDMFQPMPNLRL